MDRSKSRSTGPSDSDKRCEKCHKKERKCTCQLEVRFKNVPGPKGDTGDTGPTGPPGPVLELIPVGRTVFVDSVFGVDATAEFQNLKKPALTVRRALEIAAANNAGLVLVYLWAGTYPTDSDLPLLDNVTVQGRGRNVTRIIGQFNTGSVSATSSVADVEVDSAGSPVIIHTGTGIVNIKDCRFQTAGANTAVIVTNGTVQMNGGELNFSRTTWDPTAAVIPAVVRCGNGTNNVTAFFSYVQFFANYGTPTGPVSALGPRSLPTFFRGICPSQAVSGFRYPVSITSSFNTFNVTSNGPAVAHTRYTAIVDLPDSAPNSAGFAILIRASNDAHYVNVDSTYDSSQSQMTLTAIESESDSNNDTIGGQINVNFVQWSLADVPKSEVDLSCALTNALDTGTLTVSVMTSYISVLGTANPLAQFIGEVDGYDGGDTPVPEGGIKAQSSAHPQPNPGLDKQGEYNNDTKTNGAGNASTGTKGTGVRPIPSQTVTIQINPERRGESSQLVIDAHNDGNTVDFILHPVKIRRRWVTYVITNTSNSGMGQIHGSNLPNQPRANIAGKGLGPIPLPPGQRIKLQTLGGAPTVWHYKYSQLDT